MPMKKVILLYCLILMGVLFEIVPFDSEPLSMFPLSDVQLPFKTWLYFTMEHFILIAMSYIIYAEATEYHNSCLAFFVLQIFDMIDYFITYNTLWTDFISFNIVAMVIFGITILSEFKYERT